MPDALVGAPFARLRTPAGLGAEGQQLGHDGRRRGSQQAGDAHRGQRSRLGRESVVGAHGAGSVVPVPRGSVTALTGEAVIAAVASGAVAAIGDGPSAGGRPGSTSQHAAA